MAPRSTLSRSEILAKVVKAIQDQYGIKPPKNYHPDQSYVCYKVIRQHFEHRVSDLIEVRVKDPDEWQRSPSIYLVTTLDRHSSNVTYRRNKVGIETRHYEVRPVENLDKVIRKHLPKFKELYDLQVQRVKWKAQAAYERKVERKGLGSLATQITTELGWQDPEIHSYRNTAEFRTPEGTAFTLRPGSVEGTVSTRSAAFEDLYPREFVYLMKAVQAMRSESGR